MQINALERFRADQFEEPTIMFKGIEKVFSGLTGYRQKNFDITEFSSTKI